MIFYRLLLFSLKNILQTLNKAEGAKLPSAEGYTELKGDLALKEREVKNSEMTMDAILIGTIHIFWYSFQFNTFIERDRRMQDLEKVNQLESKLSTELDQLKAKIQAMSEDLRRLDDVEAHKEKAEKAKAVWILF